MATRKNPDGTISFFTIHPGESGFEFVVSSESGKRGLIIRDGQHEYHYVEAPPKLVDACHVPASRRRPKSCRVPESRPTRSNWNNFCVAGPEFNADLERARANRAQKKTCSR